MLLSSFSIKFGLRSFTYLKNMLMNMAVSGLETKTHLTESVYSLHTLS